MSSSWVLHHLFQVFQFDSWKYQFVLFHMLILVQVNLASCVSSSLCTSCWFQFHFSIIGLHLKSILTFGKGHYPRMQEQRLRALSGKRPRNVRCWRSFLKLCHQSYQQWNFQPRYRFLRAWKLRKSSGIKEHIWACKLYIGEIFRHIAWVFCKTEGTRSCQSKRLPREIQREWGREPEDQLSTWMLPM